MPDRLESLEGEIAALHLELEAVRARLAALEAGPRPAPVRREPMPAPAPEAGSYLSFAQALAPLAGRTLLVLAGAFVLRAVTDAGAWPAAAGVSLGFAYAGAVLVLALRERGGTGASFHLLTAVLIGFPLLVEATTRFKLLGPAASAFLLAVLAVAVLGVAARRGRHAMAWVAGGATAVSALVLMLVTGRIVPAALALVAIGLFAHWIGELAGWSALRWPLAAAADLAVLVALGRVGAERPESPGPALATGLALLAGYLGSFAARTLYLGRDVRPFEMVQTGAALLAGLGGTAMLASRAGTGTLALGTGALVLAALTYGVAFAFVERRQRGGANFPFYASVALAFTLAGVWLAVPGGARGAVLGSLALVAAVTGALRARRTLALHAAVLGVFAAASSGLAGHALDALLGPDPAARPSPSAAALAVLFCLAAAALVAARAGAGGPLRDRIPQLVLDATATLACAGVAAGWAARALGPAADPAMVDTVRSAVLAATAVLAAWLGRRAAGREAGWLAWPTVALLALKLVLEDFPGGRPATLILSLAFAGAALILVPRLRAPAAR